MKPSLRFDDCYFQVSYCNTKVSKLLWQGIKVSRLRYYILFITEFYLIYKYHRTSKKMSKIDTNGCRRLGIFKQFWETLLIQITISIFMSSCTSGTSLEVAACPLKSFIALIASEAKLSYHFTSGIKKFHPLHGQVTKSDWTS